MNLKTLAAITALSALTLLGGCATHDVWNVPVGGSQQRFTADDAGCRLVAMGVPQVQAYHDNSSDVGGMGAEGDGLKHLGNGMADLSAALATQAHREQAYRYCMISHGYSLQDS